MRTYAATPEKRRFHPLSNPAGREFSLTHRTPASAPPDNHRVLKSTGLLAAVLVAGQVSDAQLDRFGRVGQALTEADITHITSLAKTYGKSPRLVLGESSMVRGLAVIRVFLEPDAADTPVQRGTMLRLETETPPKVPEGSVWRVTVTQSFACIAAPGRRHFEISSAQDIGWPFLVDGQFDDETLLSLVAFIRTRPRFSETPEGVAMSGAPISSIVRRNNEVVVTTRTGELQGERVTLVRRGAQWVMTRFNLWIV